MEEIWKPCKRNEDYEVSNLGYIRNARKKVLIRKPNIAGYIRAYLGSAGTVSLHILIAEAFIPKLDPSRNIVNHIDGIRHNNQATNLEWVTHKENCNRKVFPCIKPNRPTTDDLEGETWTPFIYQKIHIQVSNLVRLCTKSGVKTAGSKRKDEYMCIRLRPAGI